MSKHIFIFLIGLLLTSSLIAQTVSITSTAPSNTILAGANVTFTASASGFTSPSYQWYKNNLPISGQISPTFQTNTLINNDQIKVAVRNGASSSMVSNGLTLNLDAGDVSSYPGTGTIWNDISGSGTPENGTLQNFTPAGIYSADNGGAINFDGNDDYVSLPPGVYFNGDFTIQSWIYPTSVPNWTRVLDFGNGAGINNVLLAQTYGTSGQPGMYVEGGQYQANTVLPLNQWSHLVATLQGTTATMYLNGVNIGVSTLPVAQNVTRNNNYIGKSNWGSPPDPNFNGKISNLQIYNRALSNAEIITNYNALLPRFSSVNSNIITISVPTITISSPLSQLNSTCTIASPSTPTTLVATGTVLTSALMVASPIGFEISASQNSGYASSLILTPDGAGTVSSTLYIRLSAGYGGGISGTITASSAGATTQTSTVSSTTVAPPSFSPSGPFSICNEATCLAMLATPNAYNGWSTSDPNVFSVNSAGYITATASGTATATITYTDACGQSVSQTVSVLPAAPSLPITDNRVAFKFNGNPQGPSAGGATINYAGYDGYSYYGQTQPTQVGYYKANIQSGNEAGCPNRFYIFTCTTCGN
jgi:hypothetical protein